jgi:hypothetical protein
MLLSTLSKLAMTSPTVTNRADKCLAGARPKWSGTVSFGLLQCDFKNVAPLGSGVKAVESISGVEAKGFPEAGSAVESFVSLTCSDGSIDAGRFPLDHLSRRTRASNLSSAIGIATTNVLVALVDVPPSSCPFLKRHRRD